MATNEPLTKSDFDVLNAGKQKRRFTLSSDIPRTVVGFSEKYLPFKLSPAWRAVKAAAYGEPVDLDEFEKVCGHRSPRPGGYSLTTVIAGRRGGKSANEACDAIFEAVVRGSGHMRHLAAGQRGYILVVSRTQRQALEVFRYGRGIIESHQELAALVDGEILESQNGGEIRFGNGVTLSVFPASKGSVRGFTILHAILDELAWLSVDELSANSDKDIVSAVRFGMLKPKDAPPRRMAIISSPATKSGLVYEHYEQFFGKPDSAILVAHGGTAQFNPSIDPADLEEERKRDPRTFVREVLAEFVDAIAAWCDAAAIDRASTGRHSEPNIPRFDISYSAAVDMAFRRDRSTLAIGHVEPGDNGQAPRLVVDGVWAWTPTPDRPLDARVVVGEMAEIMRQYRIYLVVGDQFASIPLAGMFEQHGIRLRELTATSQSKLDHFGKLRELFYSEAVSLPKNETLLTELRELEERITPSGNVQIGHPNRATAHDDHAAAVCWLYAATRLYRAADCVARYTAPTHVGEAEDSDEHLRRFIEERHFCYAGGNSHTENSS